MAEGNGSKPPPCADTTQIDPSKLLLKALQEKVPAQCGYLRDAVVRSKRGKYESPGEVTLSVPDALVKSVRGPIEKQRVVAVVVLLPPPAEPSRIILPHQV